MSTFGYETAGSSTDYGFGGDGTDYALLGKYALSEDGDVSKLTASLANSGASSLYAKGVIYDDNGAGGIPGTLLGVTPALELGAASGKSWRDLSFAAAVELTTGSYWLGIITLNAVTGGGVFYSTDSGGSSGYDEADYTTPANIIAWPNPGSYQMSVYATYEGAGTAPTVTTTAISDITATTATGGGTITDPGSEALTAYGVCWNTTGTPTTADSHTHDEP